MKKLLRSYLHAVVHGQLKPEDRAAVVAWSGRSTLRFCNRLRRRWNIPQRSV